MLGFDPRGGVSTTSRSAMNEALWVIKVKYNKYYFVKDYVVGITNNTGSEFIIDYEDYPNVCNYTWNEKTDGGYIVANYNNTKIYLHRFIFDNLKTNEMIDHINHNVWDNRRSNLRVATNSQNQMNRDKPITNTSKVKGVYWHKNKQKWQANIQINGTLLYLGIFESKEDAITARKQAEEKYFGCYNYSVDTDTQQND